MKIYKVSELIEELNWLLEDTYPYVFVEGEASNVKVAQKGHLYFSLKDEKALIKVVMWASFVYKLPFKVEEGRVFVVSGILKIFGPAGSFQLEARKIEPSGLGGLKLALEQRKKKLEAEGLFSPERKRPIPFFPNKIGVITSPEGAALVDFLKILKECRVALSIYIYPSLMQGKKAGDEIIEGLHYFKEKEVDLIVITRGGGSFEDLMVFNEEFLVREIASSPIPVLSAVGHEVDVTLCDLVADIRAATPTDAARVIKNQLDFVYDKLLEFEKDLIDFISFKLEKELLNLKFYQNYFSFKNLIERIKNLKERINYFINQIKEKEVKYISKKREKFNSLNFFLTKKIYTFTFQYKNKVSNLEIKLKNLSNLLNKKKEKIEGLRRGLLHLNIKRTLKRGFSILKKDGKIIRSSGETREGENIKAELYEGGLLCQIIKKD